MQTKPNSPFSDDEAHNGVCVVDGHGAKLYVHHGHLIIEDGAGRQRRTRRLHKATTNITRLVLLARSGFLTVEAIQWLTDARIGLIHLDPNGQLIASSASPIGHNPTLRRSQALAATQPIGIEITRFIIEKKINGQLAVAGQLADEETCENIAATLEDLEQADTLDQLRLVEAAAALAYWAAWTDTPIHYVKADLDRIPDHWQSVGPRRSPISRNQRQAATPAQAILNYLYALLEAEARIACATAGLDPAVGILHADQPYRDSLALDVMEPVRPRVDRYVLDLIQGHHFRRTDFYENRRGSCRINRQLAHTLAETTGTWQDAVAPIVEQVTRTLTGKRRSWQRPAPTRLTQTNRQAGREKQRRRQTREGIRRAPKPTGHCLECGTTVPPAQQRCPSCNNEHRDDRIATLANLSWETRTQQGKDPAHGAEAARKRGETSRRENLASAEWDRSNERPDGQVFARDILPRLQAMTVTAMAQATGLSSGYCSMIKRGIKIPHPRHWQALIRLTK